MDLGVRAPDRRIAVPLLELIDEEPEAVEELRGRSFARVLH